MAPKTFLSLPVRAQFAATHGYFRTTALLLAALSISIVIATEFHKKGPFQAAPVLARVRARLLPNEATSKLVSRGLGMEGRSSACWLLDRRVRSIIRPKSSASAKGPMSWEDLSEKANKREFLRDFTVRKYPVAPTTVSGVVAEETEASNPASTRKVILYRDTNAWCPFCERVWMALLEKDIEFEQCLIDLFDKPDWYKELVPTAETPAISINGKVFWESAVILDEIEKAFPTPSLNPRKKEEEELASRIKNICEDAEDGLGVRGYGYMRSNVTTEEEAKTQFEKVLSKLESELSVFEGPFFLPHFSKVDILVTPQLERFNSNLAHFKGFQIKGNKAYPKLTEWYKAMDKKASYRAVKSDDKTLNQLMSKIFRLSAPKKVSPEATLRKGHPRREAAAKLVANYDAVAADIVKNAGIGKNEKSRSAVDIHLRRVVLALLEDDPGIPSKSASEAAVGAASLAFLRNRVSSPRDMTAAAAEEFRSAVDSVLLATYDGGHAQEE